MYVRHKPELFKIRYLKKIYEWKDFTLHGINIPSPTTLTYWYDDDGVYVRKPHTLSKPLVIQNG